MSVYFIRHEHLVKIGYSSNLRQRAAQIMGDIAGPAEFIGHMPGERDMEAHLHKVFAAQRFAGEWFFETDQIRAFEAIALDPVLPPKSDPMVSFNRRLEANEATNEMQVRIRSLAARLWPEASHLDRKCHLQQTLGWTRRRVKSLYEGEQTANVRQVEADQISELETGFMDYAPFSPRMPQPNPDGGSE
jgi:hypothetical protein